MQAGIPLAPRAQTPLVWRAGAWLTTAAAPAIRPPRNGKCSACRVRCRLGSSRGAPGASASGDRIGRSVDATARGSGGELDPPIGGAPALAEAPLRPTLTLITERN